MTLTEILTSAIEETASVVPDLEHGPGFLIVDGMVDVGAIVAHVLDHAAHIADSYRVPTGGDWGRTRAALPSEIRDHLASLAADARLSR